MPINRTILLCILFSIFFLTGCMSETIKKEIKKTEEANQEIRSENPVEKEWTPENVKLDDEQLKALKDLEQKNATEALFENDLEIRKELNIQVPEKRSFYTNVEELSQYISYLFFAYHSGSMDAKTFTDEIIPLAHSSFIEQLPSTRENQIKTFEILQEKYREQLGSLILNYTITDITYQKMQEEAMFFRKYTLSNGKEVYSATTLKKEGTKWTLLDDSPATPYLTPELTESIFADEINTNEESSLESEEENE